MSTAKSSVNVKIDTHVKKTAAEILARMGIDQTTAIDMFYRKIIIERRLPFLPEPLPSLDEQLLAAIKRSDVPTVRLEADENGCLIVDKDENPDIYDWVENG
jgi:addiction module RelB/DinJ family antitoxin